MDFEYGCATNNKYAFFDENECDDPSEMLARAEAAKAAKAKANKEAAAKAAKAAKSAAKAGGRPLQAQTDNKDKQQRVSESGNKGGKVNKPSGDNKAPTDKENATKSFGGDRRQGGGFRGGDRNVDRPQGDRPPRRPQGDRPPRTEGGGDRRQGGYRGGNTRRRHDGHEGGEGGQRRQFERHSGSEKTGIKHVDTKNGAGKGNWGTTEDEIAATADVQAQENQEGESGNWAARVDESEETAEKKDGETGEGGENKEDQPSFMTLDEYKQLKNAVNNKNSFNVRKPGEGEDASKWSNTYVLKTKEDSEEEEEEEEEEVEEDEAELKKKALASKIQIKFNDTGRERRDNDRRDGGRGGFGGNRGDRRSGGGDRGDRPPRREPKPEGDTSAEAKPEGAETTEKEAPARQDRPPRREGGFGGDRRHGGDRNQGGRGGNQGNRGGNRGGQRGGPRAHVPKIEDERDFPSLS